MIIPMKIIRRYYLLLLFLLLFPVMYARINEVPRGVLWSDCEGYYLYLPAMFIIGDFHQLKEGSMWPQRNEQGEIVIKYTCGVALFECPFFLAAKWYCDAKGYDTPDYFNIHYCRAIAICGYFFGFLGLFFLRKALLQRGFSEKVAFWTLIAVFFGTNLFHYTTKEMGMSHVYSFCLFALLAWHTPRFLARPGYRNALLLGGMLGWIVLIRPTGALAALFVALYDVYTMEDLKKRGLFFLGHWPKLAAAAGAAFLFFVPQMFYWHEMTGHWLRWSYENEGFIYWNAPKIAAVLFDTQNGLFLYSPMALLMVAGVFAGLKTHRHHAPALLLIFSLATYVFASWWAWWFGGAFGHRCYVEFYALLAFPLAGVFKGIFSLKSGLLRRLVLAGIVFLMFYSVRMSFLYNYLLPPWDGEQWRWNPDKIIAIWSHLFDFLFPG